MSLTELPDTVDKLTRKLVELWPEHEKFTGKSLANRSASELETAEAIAKAIYALSDNESASINRLIADYRFLCEEIVLPEEIHFRREGHYRLKHFADAEREVYANAPFMSRYMNGLLMTEIFWANHAAAFHSFRCDFLPSLAGASHLLEVGPRHGLFLAFAARSRNVAELTGWDISQASLDHTRAALSALAVGRHVDLVRQDLFDASSAPAGGAFDAIVMSEILEHLEDPGAALRAVEPWLKPGGTVWINVPANSPAPDHIYLFENLEHAETLVREAGYDVTDAQAFPMTGATLESAVRRKLSVTCVVTARKPR